MADQIVFKMAAVLVYFKNCHTGYISLKFH